MKGCRPVRNRQAISPTVSSRRILERIPRAMVIALEPIRIPRLSCFVWKPSRIGKTANVARWPLRTFLGSTR